MMTKGSGVVCNFCTLGGDYRAETANDSRPLLGAILSAALMLEYVGLEDEAAAIEAAVQNAVAGGHSTKEIGGRLGTREAGDYKVGVIQKHKA